MAFVLREISTEQGNFRGRFLPVQKQNLSMKLASKFELCKSVSLDFKK